MIFMQSDFLALGLIVLLLFVVLGLGSFVLGASPVAFGFLMIGLVFGIGAFAVSFLNKKH